MAAKHIETRNFTIGLEKLIYQTKLALVSNGFLITYIDEKTGFILAKSNASLLSWGEKIQVDMDASGNVTIKSESAMPTQIIDWGRNRKIVRQIFDIIAIARS